jgi:flagellin-like protein
VAAFSLSEAQLASWRAVGTDYDDSGSTTTGTAGATDTIPMELKQLLNDDDAVSPVIGVILMVAITVILAAVIATFVLGLGEQVSDTAPQASFSFDYEEVSSPTDDFGDNGQSSVAGNLTVTHAGGATLNADQVAISGAEPYNSKQYFGQSGGTPFAESSEISSGDSATINVAKGDSISIVWNNEQNTNSATLSNYDVPDN